MTLMMHGVHVQRCCSAYNYVEQQLFAVRYSRSAARHRESRPVYRFKQVPSVIVWRPIFLQ